MSHNTIKPLAKNQEKYDKVRLLRYSGMSQGDIAEEMGIYKRLVADWTWDIVLTEEQKINIKLKQREKNSEYHKNWVGENNPNYRGDNIGYDAIHKWVHKNKPKPDQCEYCKRSDLELVCACIGEYKRDLDQFKWLCWSCQSKSDHKDPKRPQLYFPNKFASNGSKIIYDHKQKSSL